jgi:cell division protein ZapA (FtsZ GTPase activity inhibitor)
VKQPVEVNILGRLYTVRSSASLEEVSRVADYVNQQLARTAAVAPTADTLHVTVLTLLNIAESFLKLLDEKGALDPLEKKRLESLLLRIDSVIGG